MSACIIWPGSWNRTGDGYGYLTIGGRKIVAHRHVFETEVGPIPDGLSVLHHCDVRRCVNPEHLYAGTAKQNSHDMVVRGRARNGNVGKRRCVRGHDFTPENTRWQPSRRDPSKMERQCRKCAVIRTQEWRARRQEVG